jgi:outer membrane protein assembly factor BamA
VDFATVDLPKKGSDLQVRIVYTIRREGEKVIINDIVVNGLVRTHSDAILKAIPLRKGQILRADKITESERILYATDAFRQVIIRTEPAGESGSGYKQSNIIIDVEELKPRILNYGGGYSTDAGPLGFVDVRNVNFFGNLRQGAFRLRASRLQQLARIEYLDPRFKPYGAGEFSPLTISLQYQRDSTVTRFFRSTIDQGNQGIIQRVDENGNPIDEFGNRVGEPTVNRFTASIESQRAFDAKRQNILFIRYAYEDVRLFNLESLLLKDILEPDKAVRLSRVGASFVRDTRDSQFDPTRGEYLSFDYSLALRQLGGNISFNKTLLNYRRYYRVEKLRRTVLAGNITFGAANIFNPRDRDGIPGITEADLQLPISERFFAGGSNTLRGFRFEEAGPRQVVPDCTGQNFTTCFQQFGLFRNSKGELVRLNPFTVPVGGNALAIVNLEARIPIGRTFQLVPFYDGGNVFHTVGELFGRKDPTVDPNLRSHWSNTPGLGFGVKTPFGGTIGIDFGYLLNPPVFILPQANGDTAFSKLPHRQIHFRFTAAF